MSRHSYIRMIKIPNVKGRIRYITSRAKQENLYAIYETTNRKMWYRLAKCNQEEFRKSGTKGECIEARELNIALPEELVEYNPDQLLKEFVEHFRQKYEVDCIAALHHNKRKTNYHIHLIFAERRLLDEPKIKIASRNMYYNEKGKHVRTKKEVVDETGQLRKGCKVIKKGEVYEKILFTKKDEILKSEALLDEVKNSYTDLINLYVKDERNQLKVFDKNGPYLPTKKIGKNNPKAKFIEGDNETRNLWNQTVDRALVNCIPEEQIIQIKKSEINDKIKESVQKNGNNPSFFRRVIELAVKALELLIDKVFEKFYRNNPIENTASEVIQAIAELPAKSELAKEYSFLFKIEGELDSQNYKIGMKEKELRAVEKELEETKGLFKGKKREELQEKFKELSAEVKALKAELPKIVQKHGFTNVKEFQMRKKESWEARNDYYREVNAWEDKHVPMQLPEDLKYMLRRREERHRNLNEEKVMRNKKIKVKEYGER